MGPVTELKQACSALPESLRDAAMAAAYALGGRGTTLTMRTATFCQGEVVTNAKGGAFVFGGEELKTSGIIKGMAILVRLIAPTAGGSITFRLRHRMGQWSSHLASGSHAVSNPLNNFEHYKIRPREYEFIIDAAGESSLILIEPDLNDFALMSDGVTFEFTKTTGNDDMQVFAVGIAV